MNVTEYFVFLSLILCCLIKVSELDKSQDVVRQLVAAFEILPPGTKEETLSGTVTNLFPPIIPHGIQGPLNPPQVTGQTVLKRVGSPNLAVQSTQRFVERRATLRERRRSLLTRSTSIISKLELNEDFW